MKDLLRYKLDNFLSLTQLGAFVVGLFMISLNATANELLKDPTAPLVNFSQSQVMTELTEEENKENTSLILQGVLIENGRKIAVINNQLVRIGEEIEGYIVTSIVDYSAQLSLKEETLSLSLVSENIKISDD